MLCYSLLGNYDLKTADGLRSAILMTVEYSESVELLRQVTPYHILSQHITSTYTPFHTLSHRLTHLHRFTPLVLLPLLLYHP